MVLSTADKMFYYSYTGEAGFELVIHIAFYEKPDIEKFMDAAEYALDLYPELRFRIVVENNRLTCAGNALPLVFVPDSDRKYRFGSKDTNGHMIYFSYSDYSVTFNAFHGWSDYTGIITYLKTVLYRYATLTGFKLSEEELSELLPTIRSSETDLSVLDESDRFDPYVKYMRENSASEKFDFGPAYSVSYNQYPEGSGYTNSATFEISTSDFIKATKSYSVSFVPLIVEILSSAIRKGYQVGDEAVTAMVPVDLRPLFGSSTVTNFSDGIRVPYYKADELKTVQQRCSDFKQLMKAQKTVEYFEQVMYDKVRMVRGLEEDPRSVFEIAEEKRKPKIPGAPMPMTYGMSYVGKISFSSGLDRMIDDVKIGAINRVHSIFAYTFKDSMRFYAINRTDETVFFDCIKNGLKDAGFNPLLIDSGYKYLNRLYLEELM